MMQSPFKDKVLIIDGHARQSIALAKGFNELGCFVTAVCESKLDLCACSRYVHKNIIDKSSKENPKRKVELALREVKRVEYTLVVACTDYTAEHLSLRKDEFEEYTKTSVVDKDKFYLAFDKLKTMQICMENDLPCPKTYLNCSSADDVLSKGPEYPVIVKPQSGYGAIGFHKFDDEAALRKYLEDHKEDIPHLVIQEYIPQTSLQYECAMFIDDNNEVKSAMVFEKNRWFPVHGGSSTLNTSVRDAQISSDCSKLLQLINWRGPADIDLIRDPRDGKAKIMEINPRMSGSTKIVFLSGVNMAKQLLQRAKGEEVTAYPYYLSGVRLRCLYTDLLWFIKSKDRFKAKPSWFNFARTHEQIFSLKDPKPFFGFTITSMLKLKKELKKRGE